MYRARRLIVKRTFFWRWCALIARNYYSNKMSAALFFSLSIFVLLFLSCVSVSQLQHCRLAALALPFGYRQRRIASNLIMRDEPTIRTHLFITYIFTHKFDSFHFVYLVFIGAGSVCSLFFVSIVIYSSRRRRRKHEGNNAFRCGFFLSSFLSISIFFIQILETFVTINLIGL